MSVAGKVQLRLERTAHYLPRATGPSMPTILAARPAGRSPLPGLSLSLSLFLLPHSAVLIQLGFLPPETPH